MEYKENTYGLSEGVFKACQFLGLKFPSKAVDKSQPVPSDYFGDDFELSDAIKEKLKAELKWSDERFTKVYRKFTGKFLIQKCFKHTKTDLNVYFCDQVLFAARQNGAVAKNYFHFAFYKKSFAERSTFFTHKHYLLRQIIMTSDFYYTTKLKQTNFFPSLFIEISLTVAKALSENLKRLLKNILVSFPSLSMAVREEPLKLSKSNLIKI